MNKRKSNSVQLSGSFLFNRNYNEEQQSLSNQYKATQLWHTSVETFLSGIPLSQHRSRTRVWKVYDASFTGVEAVTWFHDQLRQKLDRDISREQIKKLLAKFYRVGVFKKVEQWEEVGGDEKGFKDSHLHIYELAMDRPGVEKKRSPSPKKEMKKNYSVEVVPLSVSEKERICFELVKQLLDPLVATQLPFIPETRNVWANLQPKTPGSGSVFPPWIIPMMKYFTNYPDEAHVHVNYPDFEKDVFEIIMDYFKSYCSKEGMLIENPPLFLQVWNNIQPQLAFSKYQEKFPFPKSEFEEIDKIFTPKSENGRRFIMGKNRRKIFDTEESNMTATLNVTNSPAALDESIGVKPMGLLDETRYRSSIYYATSFDVKSPVTRVLSQSELFAYDNPTLNLSPADLINHPKYGKLRGQLTSRRRSLSVGDLVDDESEDGGFANRSEPVQVQTTTATGTASPETKQPATEALSLLLLTLTPEICKHLEILLKFISKAGNNERLSLDVAASNKDVLYDQFARFVMGDPYNPKTRSLVTFMVENVDNLFKCEYLESFKTRALENIKEKEIKKVPMPPSKENHDSTFCSRITLQEYEDQRLLGETAPRLRDLLDSICELKDETIRRKQLKKFQKEYPHIYSEKFNNLTTLSENSFQKQKHKKRAPFGVLI